MKMVAAIWMGAALAVAPAMLMAASPAPRSPVPGPAGSQSRPASAPATRPATKPATAPAIRPATPPALRPTTAPLARPSTKPATSPAARPATLPASRPATLPALAASPSPYDSNIAPTARTQIDRLALSRLEKAGIPPANLCTDGAYLRRAFLGVIGTLPTEQEAREFLQSKDPNKRWALVDRLLERDEFAEYWTMKWCDLLRVKAEFPINLWPNAAQAYHRWILASLKENKPYDRFARELLTSSGSNFRVGPVNFYRAVQGRQPASLAQAVALTFMGVRADQWPKERLAGLAAFFSQVGYKYTGEWKEEIVFYDPNGAGPPSGAVFPDGSPARLAAGRDPREAFADWLLEPNNPFFARNIVNRAWCWLVGRGIVHEPDDIRPDNPPSNPELLAYLEREFVASRYDLKRLYRLILNSQTFQLSCEGRSKRPEAAALFASYPMQRLEAEVLIDAICQVTGTTEKYSSPIPEPFTFVPENVRAISLPDGSITSPFLDLFGHSPRDTGLESERNNRPTSAQRLHLLNSSHIQRKIEQGRRLAGLMQARLTPRETATSLYLTILSRYPTDAELKAVVDSSPGGPGRYREATIDLVWALINSPEFLYRH